MENKFTDSIENYLEYIYACKREGLEGIKSIDIAKHFSFSRPAITKAMDKLISLNLIYKNGKGEIFLSEEGEKIGLDTYKRHLVLKELLINIGVSDEQAEIDCCKIEHVISDETFTQIENLLNKIKKNKTSL